MTRLLTSAEQKLASRQFYWFLYHQVYIFLFMGCLLIGLGLHRVVDGHADWGIVSIMLGGLNWCVILWWIVVQINKLNQDFKLKTLAEVEGVVQLSTNGQNIGSAYYVHIQDKVFVVRDGEFLQFQHGASYRIYYLPHTQRMVDFELKRE